MTRKLITLHVVVVMSCMRLLACPVSEAGESRHLQSKVVQKLVSASENDDHQSFLAALATLARIGEWKEKKSFEEGHLVRRGRAKRVNGRKGDVLVFLHWPSLVIPGPDVQQVILLDERGNRTDDVLCVMNSRLTQDGCFEALYVVGDVDNKEKYVSICFSIDDPSGQGRYSYRVHWSGGKDKFIWDSRRKELCRFRIKGDKLILITPIE